MTLVGAMVSSHGVAEKFIPLLQQPKNAANAGNDWFGLFNDAPPHIPQRLVLFAFLLCLTALLRRQWVDNENLSFPLAQLPLEIAGEQDRPAFFRDRLMWGGTLIPIVVFTVKWLHQMRPTVPDITLQWNLRDFVTAPPWDQAAGQVFFILSFAAVGFFFLLPTDVLFSLWFFFLLSRVEMVGMIAYNLPMPGMPAYPPPLFIGYQTVGAYLVLSAYFLWTARAHLRRVVATALGRPGGYSRAEDAEELLPYRFALWGLLGSIAAAALWTWGMGMSLWLALGELVVFIFVTALVMARSTAEAGMLMTETTFRPVDLYRMVAPAHALGAQNLTLLAFFDTLFLRDQRGLLLTGMLDAARISDGARVRRRSFVGALVVGILIAFLVAVPLDILPAVPPRGAGEDGPHGGAGPPDVHLQRLRGQHTDGDPAASRALPGRCRSSLGWGWW